MSIEITLIIYENHNQNKYNNNSGDMIWDWDDHDTRKQDKIDAVIL